jgi:hypothetical protein
MSKAVSLSRMTWLIVSIVALLQTVIGLVATSDPWRFNIQLPGIAPALLLLGVLGPVAPMFGLGGGAFLVVATVLTNVLVYSSLITLALLLRAMFAKRSDARR